MTKRNAASNVVVILALCLMLSALAACGKRSPTQPDPPPVGTTPTAPVITGIEFHYAPTGLGDPRGPLVTGPVPMGSNIRVVMIATVNTDRNVNRSLKVFDPAGNVVAEISRPDSPVQASFNANMLTDFVAKKTGVYTPMAQISDAYGADSRQSPTLIVQ